jgi:hypothetical protein
VGFGCSLKSDREVQFNNKTFGVFDYDEREELAVLINKFEDCIGENVDKQKLYFSFFSEMNKITSIRKLYLTVDSIFGHEKIHELVSESTFSKIWEEGDNTREKTVSKRSLSIDLNSPYSEFLKRLAQKKGGIVSNYYNSFIIGGNISPSMVAMIQKQYDMLDIRDDEVCLLLAIHYLTISTTPIIEKLGSKQSSDIEPIHKFKSKAGESLGDLYGKKFPGKDDFFYASLYCFREYL